MTRLGILGGGQLAQMLIQAAVSLGVETAVFERSPDSPASRLTHHQVVGQWSDRALLPSFTKMCDVVTLENEFVDANVLEQIEQAGLPVYPSSQTLACIQDKLAQKHIMKTAGLPMAAFQAVDSPESVLKAAESYGWPLLLKARRDGYDGYGNATLHDPGDVLDAWQRLTRGGRPLLVEAFVPFVRELAVMVLRGQDGETRSYPVVETVQRDHICHVVRAPAVVPPDVAQNAQALAEKAVEAVNGVGVFGIELFLLEDDSVLYNEIAPRPHNSGHYTIEGCVTSQFENHIRAVLGWPLGPIDMTVPTAVMVNILGGREGKANPTGIQSALAVPGAHLHIYGKRDVRVGRKMGHVTVLGDSLEAAEALARQAADLVEL